MRKWSNMWSKTAKPKYSIFRITQNYFISSWLLYCFCWVQGYNWLFSIAGLQEQRQQYQRLSQEHEDNQTWLLEKSSNWSVDGFSGKPRLMTLEGIPLVTATVVNPLPWTIPKNYHHFISCVVTIIPSGGCVLRPGFTALYNTNSHYIITIKYH